MAGKARVSPPVAVELPRTPGMRARSSRMRQAEMPAQLTLAEVAALVATVAEPTLAAVRQAAAQPAPLGLLAVARQVVAQPARAASLAALGAPVLA